MVELYTDHVDALECERAAKIMAEIAVFSAQNPELEDKQREIIMGSFILATAYTDFKNDYDYENKIYNYLVEAGGSNKASASIADIVSESGIMRYIFSLEFLDQDYPKFGLRVGKINRWIEPQKFIGSILKLK